MTRARAIAETALGLGLFVAIAGSFVAAAPFAVALEMACGGADARARGLRERSRRAPRPSIYRDGYVHS